METFTLNPRGWRMTRIFGRNPLLRRSDRIEAAVMLVVLMASLLALPVAGVVGIAVYGARDRLYAQEARERQLTKAVVTDVGFEDSGVAVANVKWPVAAGEHTASLRLSEPVKAGAVIELWVDKRGNPAPPPTPAWHAVDAAVGTALLILLIAGTAITSLQGAAVRRLDRAREARWERDLRYLVEGGGRANRP